MQALEDAVIAVMIEKASAVERVEDVGILFDWFKSNGAKLRATVGA